MVAGCKMTCIKYTVFFVNFAFFFMGLVAISLGIYALLDKNDMEILTMVDSEGKLETFNAVGLLQKGAIFLIIGGAALLVLGFLGCCGAIRESKCLLSLYIFFLIIIVIFELTAAGLAIAFSERISDYLLKGLKGALITNYDGTATSSNAFSRAFDFAQVYFKCCGVTGPADFNCTKWYSNRPDVNMTVPATCCELKNIDAFLDNNKIELADPTCPFNPPSDDNPYTSVPCFNKIKEWVHDRAAIIIGIAIAIVFNEILAICMACSLYRAIED